MASGPRAASDLLTHDLPRWKVCSLGVGLCCEGHIYKVSSQSQVLGRGGDQDTVLTFVGLVLGRAGQTQAHEAKGTIYRVGAAFCVAWSCGWDRRRQEGLWCGGDQGAGLDRGAGDWQAGRLEEEWSKDRAPGQVAQRPLNGDSEKGSGHGDSETEEWLRWDIKPIYTESWVRSYVLWTCLCDFPTTAVTESHSVVAWALLL